MCREPCIVLPKATFKVPFTQGYLISLRDLNLLDIIKILFI